MKEYASSQSLPIKNGSALGMRQGAFNLVKKFEASVLSSCYFCDKDFQILNRKGWSQTSENK